jgi:hypothetical protein
VELKKTLAQAIIDVNCRGSILCVLPNPNIVNPIVHPMKLF